jgi:hypothetical protein
VILINTTSKIEIDTINDLKKYHSYRTVTLNVNKIPEYFKIYINIEQEKRKELYYKFNTRYGN